MARRRRARIRRLRASNDVMRKLAAHSLSFQDAEEVLRTAPKFARQRARWEPQPDGTERHRPQRVVMIGPNRSGRLLRFTLEWPSADGLSYVVTGWEAGSADVSSYNQPGGLWA